MTDRIVVRVFFLVRLFLSLFMFTSAALYEEQVALLDLRSTLGLRARDWPRKIDPCVSWVGVKCGEEDDDEGRVVGINVSGLRRTRLGRRNPTFSVEGLRNLTRLREFNASGFRLPGEIPDWLGGEDGGLRSLRVIDLRECWVIGSIPAGLGNLSELKKVYLSGNSLTGGIPGSVGKLKRLEVLDLSQNSLAGSIPGELSELGNVSVIDLSSNVLFGPIPSGIGSLGKLQSLYLFNNSLSSSIPVEIGNLSSLLHLDLKMNVLSGTLPYEILWLMPVLRSVDLSHNNLTGFLFNVSLNWNGSLATYNLSQNQFYGNLSAAALKRFSYIDLSDNYFEGMVSTDIQNNTSLISNCLQNVASQKSFNDCTLFYSGIGLSFNNFRNPNTTQPPSPSLSPGKKNNRWLAFILAGIFGGLGVLVILAILLVLCLRRRDRGVTADQTGRSVVTPAPTAASSPATAVTVNFSNLGDAFTYEQLFRAADEFSESNLMKHGHSGDLFRGVLENGVIVVIKRVDLRLIKKESHMKELDLFSKISHSRLVPLLGYCLEHEYEKLMVYKYMPNGDLSNSLFKKVKNQEDDSLQSLDWITRLKIATGAAEGLNYLHHECNPPLVHRDVQASSILLDDKYEVRLGSLSEVCSQGDAHQSVITRFLRLPQTSEPGPSGSQSTNCAFDVYCFGKVLLELVTGKLGISATNDISSTELLDQLLPYITISDRELVTKIVDPNLIVDEDLLEEVWAMAVVARSCLNPKPSKRPLMKYILKALENPLKVVRQDSSSSGRLRTTSSRGSWGVFGSWRLSSSESANAPNREGSLRRMSGNNGSQGSGVGAGDILSSNKKLSRDIFPEPGERSDDD